VRRLSVRRKDEGAIAVLVAVLLSGGVLLGMGALVIDVGLIASEREQLQSGADAAAWGVAADCPADPDGCAARAPALAAANAGDGAADTSVVVCASDCATEQRIRTSPCLDLPAGLQNGGVAEVRTTTRTASGGTLIPPVFAGALTGGTAVAACSQVVWGTPATAPAVALGISSCDWTTGTADGATLPGADQVIAPDTFAAGPDCGADVPAGWQPTAGFSWFTADADDCILDATVGRTWARPLFAQPCTDVLDDALATGQPILVALTDAVLPLSAELTRDYRIAGLAGFEVTGYRAGTATGGEPCPGTADCLSGRFVRMLVPVHDALPGDTRNYGATLISRIG
jgi:Flp pilus assembly protein TadG